MKQGNLFEICNTESNSKKVATGSAATNNTQQKKHVSSAKNIPDVSRETSGIFPQGDGIESKSCVQNSASEYTVSQISQLIKSVLESSFANVVVKGEISEITRARSGHVYFTIKDESSTLSVICWRDVFNALKVNLDIGLEVICTGKISSYPLRSNYQFILTDIKISGDGTLLKLFQERKAKLEKMGIFDPQHKLKIPKFPKSICVITSESGAVIKDIIHRIRARYPMQIYLYHCQVQGLDAHLEIITALQNLNDWNSAFDADASDICGVSASGIRINPDLIIIARGGGSAQDLWPFNEEDLALAVYNSKIPIISAVGHETDFTLCDFASDLRAPTPTAAAELAVPNMHEIVRYQRSIFNGIYNNLCNILRISERNLSIISKNFVGYTHQLELKSTKLNTLLNSVEYLVKMKLNNCEQLIGTLSSDKIALQIFRCIDLYNNRIEQSFRVIQYLNPTNILKKGYSIVRKDDAIISSAEAFNETENQNFSLQFADGIVEVVLKKRI